MAKIKLQGHASGSGIITLTAPNTSTDRVISLPDATATIATTTDVAARLPSITDGGNATAMTIDSSEKIIIGDATSHTTDLLQIETPASGGGHGIQIRRNDTNTGQGVGHILFGNNTATDLAKIAAGTDGAADSGYLILATQPASGNLTDRMTINSSGNAGIGVTPSSWPSNGDFRALQVGSGLSLYGRGSNDKDRVGMTANAYVDVTNDRFEYIGTGHATHYRQSDGTHDFQTAASGSADGAITFSTVMSIDATGAVTKPAQPAFLVNATTLSSFSASTNSKVDFDTERFDVNSDFNVSTQTFTAPVTGKYHLDSQVLLVNWDSSADYYYLQIITSNRTYYELRSGEANPGDPSYTYMQVHALADMDAGDTAYVNIFQSGGAAQTGYDNQSFFSGYLAC